MDLHMSSVATLVPDGSWCVFYATSRKVYWGLKHNIFFAGPLIWYHTHTHTHTHKDTHKDKHKDPQHTHGASRLAHPYK